MRLMHMQQYILTMHTNWMVETSCCGNSDRQEFSVEGPWQILTRDSRAKAFSVDIRLVSGFDGLFGVQCKML